MDEGVLNTYYADADSDGYGDAGYRLKLVQLQLDLLKMIQIVMIPMVLLIQV